jgi:type IV pilus assembly protein PilA
MSGISAEPSQIQPGETRITMERALHRTAPMRTDRSAGFTMIELMLVVVVIGILAAVAVVAYSKSVKKAKAAEVPQMFGELKSKEDAFHAEFGKYLGACPNPDATADCLEGDYFPAVINGAAPTELGAFPDRWKRLKIKPGKGALYCQYEVVAGTPAVALQSPRGVELFNNTTPSTNFYYMLAQCDWDNDSTVNGLYWQRYDNDSVGRENELR